MRAYKVTAKEGSVALATRYGATQADARTKRDELVEALDVKKKDVSIEEAEIPLSKPDLLAFINELCEQGDAVEGEEP